MSESAAFEFDNMATSCEHARTRAYDPDLRWRMVYQRLVLELPFKTISQNLSVDISTVRRTLNLFITTGSVDKRPYPEQQSRQRKKLTDDDHFLLLELVLERPGIYLNELRHELLATTGTEASTATICRFLHACGFTRTKIRSVALQRSEEQRARYVSEVALYSPNMFVFVDETGSDRRDAMRKFGYSLRGKRCVATRLLVRGERVSAIAAITLDGILDYQFVHGTSNGDIFREFIERELLPHLMPFDGKNSNSIVVMDNASIHHSREVADLISSVGALLIYLPPYSPDLNPIEEAFSSVKANLKAHEVIIYDASDIETIVQAAFTNISPENCKGWFSDSGYM